MTNKEAIRILKHLQNCQYLPDDYSLEDENTDQAYDLAIKALEERPTGKWIPVSEELPEKNGFYLVTVSGYGKRPHMKILGYDAIGNRWGEGGVVAWGNISPYEQEASDD